MNSSKRQRLLMLTVLLVSSATVGSTQKPAEAQRPAAALPPQQGVVVEVMYARGQILAYQRIGEWTWYEAFQRTRESKTQPGKLPVASVKITPRHEEGAIRARVTVLRGRNHEVEDFVADYALSTEKPVIVRELTDVGVEPFELLLVRAPSTIPEPPTIVNKTRSLEISTEPSQSSLPTFLARVINNSSKPVASFTYYTSVDGTRRLSGQPRNEKGGALIAPGEAFQRTFRYPMKVSAVSTGEVPPALANLVFNVTAVVFTDGTYEGDAFAAANYLAGNYGEKTQLRSFLDLIRSKEFDNSEPPVQMAISSVNVDSVTAEFAQKFPTLTAEQKARLRDAVDFGKSLGVKLFRSASSEPVTALAERLQKRIDSLP